jgi:hypothetical protein
MTSLIESIRNKLRNALGIRKHRRRAARGPQPAPGSKIINGELRMEVADGLSTELWAWLMNLGWRKALYKYDRRRYHEIPMPWVQELYSAPADQWEKTLAAATACARGNGPLPAVRTKDVGWNSPEFEYLSKSDRAI